jgi:protein SCO1
MQSNCRYQLPSFFVIILLMLILPLFPSGVATAAASGSSIWGADYFPNIPLVTHEGKEVRFFEDLIKDKVVSINFIYTSCPDACALETARMREVQKILGDRVGRDVFLYSITIDPEHDTPEVLNEYAGKFQIGPGWLFLTGKKADITLLRKKLGLYSEEDANRDLSEHNLSQMIGNQATGQWIKVSPFENPYIMATKIGNQLHNWKMPANVKRDYADAPKVRNISAGENLFRTRCASCHTIGAVPVQPPIGPDLLDVTRKRDRAWLNRWMAEPDKMLAEKDPLAMAMLAEYRNIPMPNLRLNKVEIKALLTYIEEESHRVKHHKHGGHHHH